MYPRYVATSSWSQVSGTRDARDQEMEPFIDVSVGGQDLREGELQVGVKSSAVKRSIGSTTGCTITGLLLVESGYYRFHI